MADWFAAEGVTEVVMEATGSYWKSPWYVLEGTGVRARSWSTPDHVKILPGRKTTWLTPLAGRAARARPAALESSCRPRRSGAARPDPLPQTAHPGPHLGVPAGPKDPRGRRDQAGLGRLGCAGRVGPAHAQGAWWPANGTPKSSPSWPRDSLRKKIPELREALRGRFQDHHALLIRLVLGPRRVPRGGHRRARHRGRPGDGPFR